MRYLAILPLALATCMATFVLQSLGRTIYVNHFEFEPAVIEWNAAHAVGDHDAMVTALDKEMLAHCRTIDPFWFIERWANKCRNRP
jgi:hypothetical protein